MNRRRFLASGGVAVAATSLATIGSDAATRSPAPVLLSLTGDGGRTNRGGFDPASDILHGKHSVTFDKAFALDYGAIAALPARRIDVTLEYDRKRHALTGPLLTDVLALAGVRAVDSSTLTMRAVDGYAPTLTIAEARRHRYIVALRRDGQLLALGGLGPLWAVYEADRFPEAAAKPVDQRFATCPWALYHIDVRRA